MLKPKITQKFDQLFAVEIIELTNTEKRIVNASELPLVFRTNYVARDVAKRIINDKTGNNVTSQLFVDGHPVISASDVTINFILSQWEKQKVEFGLPFVQQIDGPEITKARPRAELIDRIRLGAFAVNEPASVV